MGNELLKTLQGIVLKFEAYVLDREKRVFALQKRVDVLVAQLRRDRQGGE